MSAMPRSRTTDQRYYGVAEALVTDVDDPQKLGRVKLKFPWFDGDMESEWCRVRQFYAGNNYGAFFIPEKGDEVLVSFIHGDMRLPIILGGLYNGKDKPPSYRDGTDKDQKMIRTKGKHEILMDDSSNDKRVKIKTEKGNVVDLSDKDSTISITTAGGQQAVMEDTGKITIETSGGQSVVMEDSGTITIETSRGQSVVMEDSGTITIETSGGQKIVLEAGKITLDAASIVLSAQDIKLGGTGASEPLVLGQTFFTAFNTHTHICSVPTSPSGPPVPPLMPTVLSKTSKTS